MISPAIRNFARAGIFLCLAGPIFSLLLPDSAWAVQQHGGTEGLVSHQIAHLLFITGMLILFLRLNRSVGDGPGWIQFKLFIILILLWNLLTFYGHWHREIINADKFIREAGYTTGFILDSPLDALFYLSRLDHLLLVPAFFFLLWALSKWSRQP